MFNLVHLEKKNAEVSNEDAEVGGRAAANEVRAAANASRKKRDTAETHGAADMALDRAIFQDHNSLLAAKMMMKYGDAEDKAKALS